MNNPKLREIALDTAYLAKCAVDRTPPDPARVEKMNLAHVLAVASRHMLTCAVAAALSSAGISDGQIEMQAAAEKYRGVMLCAYYGGISEQLESLEVWHMPLKGYILRDIYPLPEMRELTDVDVLFDPGRREDVRGVMCSIGFTEASYGKGHHDVYAYEPNLYIEMHNALFEGEMPGTTAKISAEDYYRDVKSRLIAEQGKTFAFRFTDEDFLIYMLAHEYKHYKVAGIGLRALLDNYIYMKTFGPTLNMEYVFGELSKLGVSEYARESLALSQAIFGGGELTEAQLEKFDFYAEAGAQGNYVLHVRNMLEEADGASSSPGATVIKRRIFLSDAELRYQYPFFYKHKAARPLLAAFRIGRALTKGRHKTVAQIKEIASHKKNK